MTIPDKKVFTMGQVARLCHVAPTTAQKWFDNGWLIGWRIPGSRDRRVERVELIAFMRRQKMLNLDYGDATPIGGGA